MSIILSVDNTEIIVDSIDIPRCSSKTWRLNKNNYAYTTGTIYLHRFILGAKTGQIVDHIDGDTLNNKRSNLRLVTAAQNSMNKKLRKDSATGHQGVSFNKNKKRWVAYIYQNEKMIYLGSYSMIEDAIGARTKAEQTLFGEYARRI